MEALKPFDGPSSITLDELTVETDHTMIAIYGQIEFRRDRLSLERMESLAATLGEAISLLRREDLPETLA